MPKLRDFPSPGLDAPFFVSFSSKPMIPAADVDAAVEFAARGYSVMEMDGGFEAGEENDLQVESEVSSRQRGHKRSAPTRAAAP